MYTWLYMDTDLYIRPFTGVPANYKYVFKPCEVEHFHTENKASATKRATGQLAREKQAEQTRQDKARQNRKEPRACRQTIETLITVRPYTGKSIGHIVGKVNGVYAIERNDIKCRLLPTERARLLAHKNMSAIKRAVTPKRKKAMQYAICSRPVISPITESGAQVIVTYAGKLAYTALKTIYARSANDYVRELMIQAATDARSDSVQENVYIATMDAIESMQKKVTHKYVWRKFAVVDKDGNIVVDENGDPVIKRVKTEIQEYETLEMTDTGRTVAQIADEINPRGDWHDVKQQAAEMLVSLASVGVIANYDDIWQYARIVYQSVNRMIHRNRKISAQVENMARRTEQAREQERDEKAEKALNMVEKASVVTDISNALASKYPKSANLVTEIWAYMVAPLYGDKWTVREISEFTGIHFTNVSRWMRKIETFLRNERADLLHALIYD